MKQRNFGAFSLTISLSAASLAIAAGCEAGGVGDPCTPEDEYRTDFSGFGIDEVNIESKSFQCLTRICLVNHFQGRVSCPYGQTVDPSTGALPADDIQCKRPGETLPVVVSVLPQRKDRQASKAVYCSCRCDGPDSNARYCKCPDGYSCERLVEDLGLGRGQLAGSYCVRNGTVYDELRQPSEITCDIATKDCGPVRPR